MPEGRCEMAAKRISGKTNLRGFSAQARKSAKMFRAGLYARVSTDDQQTIPLQVRAPGARRLGTRPAKRQEAGPAAKRRTPSQSGSKAIPVRD